MQPAEEARRQLQESARVKQSFSDELIRRIAQFAEKSAAGGKIVFFGNGGSRSRPRP
jgi:phosphoheptose isomerase